MKFIFKVAGANLVINFVLGLAFVGSALGANWWIERKRRQAQEGQDA